MSEILVILGILFIVMILEFLILILSGLLFNDDYDLGLIAINTVFLTILVSIIIWGK